MQGSDFEPRSLLEPSLGEEHALGKVAKLGYRSFSKLRLGKGRCHGHWIMTRFSKASHHLEHIGIGGVDQLIK